MPIRLSLEQFIRFVYILLNQERSRKHNLEFVALNKALQVSVANLGNFSILRLLSDNGKTVIEMSCGEKVTYLNEDLFRKIYGLSERRQYRAKWASV